MTIKSWRAEPISLRPSSHALDRKFKPLPHPIDQNVRLLNRIDLAILLASKMVTADSKRQKVT